MSTLYVQDALVLALYQDVKVGKGKEQLPVDGRKLLLHEGGTRNKARKKDAPGHGRHAPGVTGMKTKTSKITRPKSQDGKPRNRKAYNVRVTLPGQMVTDCAIKPFDKTTGKGLIQWVRDGATMLCLPTDMETPTSHPILKNGDVLKVEICAFARKSLTSQIVQICWEWDEWGGWRGRIMLPVCPQVHQRFAE